MLRVTQAEANKILNKQSSKRKTPVRPPMVAEIDGTRLGLDYVILVLPIPPTKNAEPGHWAARRKLKQDWESYAFSAWLLAGRPKFDTVDVYPVLFYGCRRFRDDDGAVGHRMKGILDGLKTHLVQDDNSELLTLHTAEMLIDKSYPRLELHIVGRK